VGVKVWRNFVSTKRRTAQTERSRATKRRIAAAATDLFLRDGYVQTTMSAIARESGVAYQTLYLSFGSKVAVLARAFDIAVAGDDEPIPVLERGWREELRAESDGPRALQIFFDAVCPIVGRVYPLFGAMKAASADPDVAGELHRNKTLRYATYAAVLADVASKDGFNHDLGLERATQTAYAAVSEETFGLLVAEHGWSPADWASWATRTTTAELFPPAGPP
jgi:AcrR family transcriptional regulator